LTDRKREELTLVEYEQLFAELRELGTLFLLISGGEIFHRKDGLDILKAARRNRFEVRIITHGGHIDDTLAAELAAIQIRVVAMSIYSAEPEVHDAITTVSGSWERTVEAARHLRTHGVPVMFKCVLMTGNEHVAAALQALADEVGAGIEFSMDIKGDNAGSDGLMDLNIELADRIAVHNCVYPSLIDAAALPMFSPDQHTCLAGNASCYVSPDGTVQPCLDWEEDAGNIRDNSFGEIWHESPVFQRARLIRRNSFSSCSGCSNFNVCQLCPAKSHRETGIPTGSAPSKCRETMAKMIGHAEKLAAAE
jgi:radical SAM protein with 4Fe4S-binding SPASM domain